MRTRTGLIGLAIGLVVLVAVVFSGVTFGLCGTMEGSPPPSCQSTLYLVVGGIVGIAIIAISLAALALSHNKPAL
jgi:Mg/Co/Ni transporter MgtE